MIFTSICLCAEVDVEEKLKKCEDIDQACQKVEKADQLWKEGASQEALKIYTEVINTEKEDLPLRMALFNRSVLHAELGMKDESIQDLFLAVDSEGMILIRKLYEMPTHKVEIEDCLIQGLLLGKEHIFSNTFDLEKIAQEYLKKKSQK